MAEKFLRKIANKLKREPRVVMFEELKLLYKSYPSVLADPQVAFSLSVLRQEYDKACKTLDEAYISQELQYFKNQVEAWKKKKEQQ